MSLSFIACSVFAVSVMWWLCHSSCVLTLSGLSEIRTFPAGCFSHTSRNWAWRAADRLTFHTKQQRMNPVSHGDSVLLLLFVSLQQSSAWGWESIRICCVFLSRCWVTHKPHKLPSMTSFTWDLNPDYRRAQMTSERWQHHVILTQRLVGVLTWSVFVASNANGDGSKMGKMHFLCSFSKVCMPVFKALYCSFPENTVCSLASKAGKLNKILFFNIPETDSDIESFEYTIENKLMCLNLTMLVHFSHSDTRSMQLFW